MSDNDQTRAVSFPLSAVTPGTQFLPLVSWRAPGEYAEVTCQDAFVTVRTRKTRDGVSRDEFTRLGPAGSREFFAIDDYIEIAYRVDFIGSSTFHADPNTGARVDAAAARVASISANLTSTEPRDEGVRLLMADGQDIAAPAANAITPIGYPPGYARVARVTCEQAVAGRVIVTAPTSGGTYAGYPLAPSMQIEVHAWDLLQLDNNANATVQPLGVLWATKAGTSAPAQEAFELQGAWATAGLTKDLTWNLPSGPGEYVIDKLRINRTGGANATTANAQFCGVSPFAANAVSSLFVGNATAIEIQSAISVWSRTGQLLIRITVDVAGDTYIATGVARRIYGARATLTGV